jgi:ATP-dependent Lon protease
MVAESEISRAAPALPELLPVLPLKAGTVVFPFAVMPLVIGQPRSIHLVDDVMRGERLLVLALQRTPDVDLPGPADINPVGTAAEIRELSRARDGTLQILVHGLVKVRLLDFTAEEPYLVARIEAAPDPTEASADTEGLRRAALDVFRQLSGLIPELPAELFVAAEQLSEPLQVVYMIGSAVPFSGPVRQELLETDGVDAKLRRLVELLQHELAIREAGHRIATETRERLSKAQREYFLREQLRSIQRELGEEEEGAEVSAFKRQLDEAWLPEEARREAERELARLEAIPAASPEHGIIRTYLEWMTSLPWNVLTGGAINISQARQVLDEDHYNLEKVKERILEHLAVKKLRQERQAVAPPLTEAEAARGELSREPILCFVGPPGVGKTSLGQSIARALGRKFIRISLGGVHDEAEVRGHRRTYIGAMPGRIVQGIRRSEARDPVFMLDEIDKVGADWRGDPSSALLEVLDPAQNYAFVDNYLGVPFDLSQVLFIATANTLETIAPALLDRMEVLQLSGYTDQEKVAIAQAYLVPKQLSTHGLAPQELSFEQDAIRQIVRGYTREAGVRNLEREIATICRKIASETVQGKELPVNVTVDKVKSYLGAPRFFEEIAERTQRPGVATGLAWTPSGGEVLFVEATMMPSRDEQLILTGMLGDVMRESAQAALSYVRSNAERLGIDASVFEGKTVHVHVPAGAIPKDGPSAGVTMVAALFSVASGRPVRGDVAMTGEVTLRGKVLPVGGIKEKILAAQRAGIGTVILPRPNQRDLDDLPQDLRQAVEVLLVDTAEEALAGALSSTRESSTPPSEPSETQQAGKS